MIDNRKTYYHSIVQYVLREKRNTLYYDDIHLDNTVCWGDLSDDTYMFDTREKALQYNKDFLNNQCVVEKVLVTISVVSLNEYNPN